MDIKIQPIVEQLSKEVVQALFEGGPGSGNWGHAGRPGVVGGSQAAGTGQYMRHLLKSQRGGLTSALFRLARLSATGRALASGNPLKMARRATNILIGRKVASRMFLKGSRRKKSGWLW